MKKILLSIAVAAGLSASAQIATSSVIAGNTFTNGNTGFAYSFNTAPGLSHEALNCSPSTNNGVWDTFGSAAAGDYSVDSLSNGNGFLKVKLAGASLTGNARIVSNRFPSDAVSDCGTAQGSEVGNFSAEANQVIKARVRATSDVTIAVVVSTDDSGWKTHDAIFDSQTITGDGAWTEIEFEIADTTWNGNGDLTKTVGWELWYAGAQEVSAGELHFDWIIFGDGENPNVSTNEVVATGLNVFPNPATDILNVNFDASLATTVELVDLTGKVVSTQTAQAGSVTTQFTTTDINAGVYFVNIKNANGSTTQKVVIK